MKKIFCGLVLILVTRILFLAIDFKKPLLIFDEKGKNTSEHIFFEWTARPTDGAIADDGSIWLLETFNNRLIKIDRQTGKILTFNKSGQGPGELNYPTSFAFVKDKIWISNVFNNRIEILDNNLQHAKPHPDKLALSPAAIAVNETGIIAIMGNIRGKAETEIIFLNEPGKTLNWISVEIPEKFRKFMRLWHNAILRSYGKDKFMLVFNYLPLIMILDINKQSIKNFFIDNFVKAFDVNKEKPDMPPAGFLIINASQGPEESILLSVCQQLPERLCNSLLQLNSDCSKKLLEFTFDFPVNILNYNRKRKELLITSSEKGLVFKW